MAANGNGSGRNDWFSTAALGSLPLLSAKAASIEWNAALASYQRYTQRVYGAVATVSLGSGIGTYGVSVAAALDNSGNGNFLITEFGGAGGSSPNGRLAVAVEGFLGVPGTTVDSLTGLGYYSGAALGVTAGVNRDDSGHVVSIQSGVSNVLVSPITSPAIR